MVAFVQDHHLSNGLYRDEVRAISQYYHQFAGESQCDKYGQLHKAYFLTW